MFGSCASTLLTSILLSGASVVRSFTPFPRTTAAVMGPAAQLPSYDEKSYHSRCVVLDAAKAGSFFNPVEPNDGDDEGEDDEQDGIRDGEDQGEGFQSEFSELLRRRREASSSRLKPRGFASQRIKPPPESGNKPFVGIGPPLNDITRPEYDDEGYTLYADERTGKRSRVFEALVEYPCDFTLKIVGANEGQFVLDIVQLVAESCEVTVDSLDGKWTSRLNGKWTSVTVQAPVQSADMLYALYQTIDRDPRVKFKF